MKINAIGHIAIAASLLTLGACSGESATEEQQEEVLAPLVHITEATNKHFVHQIRIQGNIETDKDILLSAEMGGLITEINVKEGQTVSKGQVIATVDASILSSNMQELQTQLEYAEYMLDKQEELSKRGVGSEFELEAAKNRVSALKASMQSLSTQQGKAIIRAPFSGVIDQVFGKKGQMAGPSAPLVRIVNNKEVDIVAGISEKHFAHVKVGTPMTVSFPNYGDTSVMLKVTNVGNYIEPTNRTFRIKSTINNNDFFLPNMVAEISITDMDVPNGMVIPSISILKDQDNNDYVYVAEKYSDKDKKIEGAYKVKKVLVKVIERFEGETLIEDGAIQPKQQVVTEGARGIQTNDIVRIQ